MPAPASIAPRKQWTTALFEDAGAGLRDSVQLSPGSLTAGAGTFMVTVPEDGTLHSVEVAAADALAASDSNYVTFTLTNLGHGGTGTTVMLAPTPENTTKATGGSGWVANGRKVFRISTIQAALRVKAGERLMLQATATGTVATTNLFTVLLRFNP